MRRKVANFGGEVGFAPRFLYRPRDESEVIGILGRHAGASIRAAGSLHSWNRGIESHDVLIDLRSMDKVRLSKDQNGETWAEAQGGCTLESVLKALARSGVTLPSLGAIKKQTIAGAISTATHGSGKPSLSGFMEEIRVAAYDGEGKARIYEWKGGEKGLLASRCAVGCMGVILSVKFRCVPDYWIAEKGRFHESIQSVLSKEGEYPLQQFILLPYSWKYFSFQRKVVDEGAGAISRALWKLYDFLAFELGTHLLLKGALFLSSLLDSTKLVPGFYSKVVPAFLSERSYVNRSEDALTLHTSHHYLFRHLEMELFVPEDRIILADSLIRHMTSAFADRSYEFPPDSAFLLRQIGLYERIMELRGSYQHHYPIFFRSVRGDQALISMTSGGKRYSASFFTYLPPSRRGPYYVYADMMAQCLTRLCQARPHWGKYFPPSFGDMAPLYPSLAEFRELADSVDPRGTFRNDFTRRTIGGAGGAENGGKG